jgi:hypothetical protein
MKVGLKKIFICLAFVSAIALACDSYFNCGPKCLRKALCKVMKAKSNHSCCQAKIKPIKTSTGKCGGKKTCQFKKTQKIATIDNQDFDSNTSDSPIFLASSNLTKSNYIQKISSSSTGPPFQSDCKTQSVLCVFII